MSSSMLEKIRQADNLPSLPTVAVQVLNLIHSDNVTVAQIAKVIEHDPALTSKILKVSNSSLFGMSRQISSLQQAVVVLGLRTVKVMALTFSLVDAMQSRQSGGFDYQAYWRRSLTAAVAARQLGKFLSSDEADELFVAALLSDIGMLAAFHVDKPAYQQVLIESESAEVPIHLIEQKQLGATHETFASHLLDSWGLPERIVSAIAAHHQSADVLNRLAAEKSNPMIPLLGAAVLIADMFCSPGGAKELPVVRSDVPNLVPIDGDELAGLLDELQKHVQETASKWAIDIGQARSYKDVQAEAVVQLAKLTMAAELERAQLAVREQELSSQNQNLARRATTDALTGIANRATLEEHLTKVCEATLQQGSKLGILMLDLDRFKKLNDTFGHQVGDTALRTVGGLLSKLNSDRVLASRYGGEEFTIVVSDATANDVRELAERVRLDIQQNRIPANGRQIALTVSIGAALFDGALPKLEPSLVVGLADKCLYQAKQTGRNRVVFQELARPAAAVAAG